MLHSAAPFSTIVLLAGLLLLLVACLYDLAWRLVPNGLPLAIAIAGVSVRIGDGNLGWGLLAGTGVFTAAALCWRRGWLGGGDVKLFGAGALLVPPGLAIGFVLASCLAGGVLALLYLAAGRIVAPPGPTRPTTRLGRLVRVERRRLQRRGPLPYATAIAAGAGFVLIGA